MRALVNENFPDIFYSVDNDAGDRSEFDLDDVAVVSVAQVAERLVGHVILAEDVKRSQNGPGCRARRVLKNEVLVAKLCLFFFGPEIIDDAYNE